ncbi:MAG: hypothetical protein KIB45_05845 [Negativicoccus succinicivorans]|uniref:DUF6148 family protein n=1 Tax=Negativicoccus succinicivorans TaxID=620903 RepID=UPI0023578956|nr:DUF6148 family protein [Negativicoccus succinicivorans]MBS5890585.1 hypothetical protein [Negativicoccus succinicivorans]
MSIFKRYGLRVRTLTPMQERQLAEAKEMRAAWIEAEKALTTGKSYQIGTRSLSRVDLSEVRDAIDYWTNEIARIENLAVGRGRAYRVIPRDL